MDFIDRIQELASRIPKQLDYCQTEEATKNAMVMPFIKELGYDVFNPFEVVPEFTADFGIKKGEKVDYAIQINGEPVMLFECKWSGANLATVHASQLYRYFATVKAVRFGILTNGIQYEFYTDLDSPNVMDQRPFFVFDMLNFQERHVRELKKFTRSSFDLDEILATASDLKYTAAMRKIISKEFENPSDDFVRFFATQVYSGRMTQNVREAFSEITRTALNRYLNDRVNERLQSALAKSVEDEVTPVIEAEEEIEEEAENSDPKRQIVTTEDEIEGFFVIKSILRETLDVKRVHMRDTKSYCGILLDDNNRKPIVRLHFNRTQKYVGVFDDDRNENRMPIDSVDDIYQYSEQIIATALGHDT